MLSVIVTACKKNMKQLLSTLVKLLNSIKIWLMRTLFLDMSMLQMRITKKLRDAFNMHLMSTIDTITRGGDSVI